MAYRIYNRNSFGQYLFDNTKLAPPSTSKRKGSDKAIALLGDHEDMVCDSRWLIGENEDADTYDYEEDAVGYLMWIKNLPRYYTEGNTIFVHAGIDEYADYGSGESMIIPLWRNIRHGQAGFIMT